MEDGLPFLVGEADVLELNGAVDGADGTDARGVDIFAALPEDFARAVEAGEGLGQLCPDTDHLEHGSNQKSKECHERQEIAFRHGAEATISRTPKYITAALTSPMRTVDDSDMSEMAVRER